MIEALTKRRKWVITNTYFIFIFWIRNEIPKPISHDPRKAFNAECQNVASWIKYKRDECSVSRYNAIDKFTSVSHMILRGGNVPPLPDLLLCWAGLDVWTQGWRQAGLIVHIFCGHALYKNISLLFYFFIFLTLGNKQLLKIINNSTI